MNSSPTESPRGRIGIQLVTVLCSASDDLPGTLQALRKLGCAGVEVALRFGGIFGRTPAEFRRLLDDAGLHCIGATANGEDLALETTLPHTLDLVRALGGRYVHQADPAVTRAEVTLAPAWERAAERFAKMSERAATFDMHVGLHNHAEEFAPLDDGRTGWQIVFSRTPYDFCHEIDTYHCIEGGGDPVSEVKAYPGRTRVAHLKEFPRTTEDPNATDDPISPGKRLRSFGTGDVPWKPFVEACRAVGGTEWFVTELWMGNKGNAGRDLEVAAAIVRFAQDLLNDAAGERR
jgi:sugar phosphate isomerase/epimerase